MVIMKPTEICQIYGGDIEDLFKFKKAIDVVRTCFEAYSRCTPIVGEGACCKSTPCATWLCCNEHCIIDLGKSGGACIPVKNTCHEIFFGETMLQCQCYRTEL